jgi:hypothetical protein
MRTLIADMIAQWHELDRRIGDFDAEFVSWAREKEDARRLTSIPGVGVTIATALIAAVGRADSFAWSRPSGVARSGSSPIDHRRKASSAPDQQARQQVPSKAIHPWRAGCTAARGPARYTVRPLGKGIAGPRSSECCSGGARQQLVRIAWAVLRRGRRFDHQLVPLTA